MRLYITSEQPQLEWLGTGLRGGRAELLLGVGARCGIGIRGVREAPCQSKTRGTSGWKGGVVLTRAFGPFTCTRGSESLSSFERNEPLKRGQSLGEGGNFRDTALGSQWCVPSRCCEASNYPHVALTHHNTSLKYRT